MSTKSLAASQRRARDGEGVRALLDPVKGFRDAQARKGIQPKDHTKDNREFIKKTEQKKKEEKEAALQTKEQFKLSRFKNVESKVTQQIATSTSAADTTHAEFVRKGSRPTVIKSSTLTDDEKQKTKTKPAVPKLEVLQSSAQPQQSQAKDFVRGNSKAVVEQSATLKEKKLDQQAREQDEQRRRVESRGKVPDYLVERQVQMAVDAEKKRAENKVSDCPPGMKKMPEAERLNTLELLKTKHQDLLREMGRLPILLETVSLKNRKIAIEKQIAEVEEAIGVFNRKVVYIKDDGN